MFASTMTIVFLAVLWVLWIRQNFVMLKSKTDTDRIIYHIYTAVWLVSMFILWLHDVK